MPQNAAGRTIDPDVWDPSAPWHVRAASAAADPLLDPPGVRPRAQGLRAGEGSNDANSVVWVLPSTTAPALRSLATAVASNAGTNPAMIGDPHAVSMPAV